MPDGSAHRRLEKPPPLTLMRRLAQGGCGRTFIGFTGQATGREATKRLYRISLLTWFHTYHFAMIYFYSVENQ